MEYVALAKTKYIKMTARKMRVVVDTVRGVRVNEALALLAVSPKKAAFDVAKTLKSAVANAENSKGDLDIDLDSLYIKEIMVDEGPTQKRWTPRAMGRASKILKRSSHLTIKLAVKERG